MMYLDVGCSGGRGHVAGSLHSSLPCLARLCGAISRRCRSGEVHLLSKGEGMFAFVEFMDDVLTTTAIAMNGFEYFVCKKVSINLPSTGVQEIVQVCLADCYQLQ